MATIQYTKYTYIKPPIISIDTYKKIKNSLNQDPSYNPYKFSFFKSYYEEFKIGLLFLIIGVPISLLLTYTEIAFLEILAGIYGFLAISCIFFGGLQSTVSFFGFLFKKYTYYQKLMRNIRRSKDYFDFKEKMY